MRIRTIAASLLCGGLLAGLAAGAQAQTPELRIGFLAQRTGIYTAIGTDMLNGFQMYLDEHNGMLGGAKVKLIIEDDQGKPDVDVAKAKKLILQDKVDMLVGALLASSAYALGPVSTELKTLYIGTASTADDLAQRQVDKYPYTVFSVWVPSQPNHPLGQWACDQGHKKIVAVAADYAFGYEQTGGFQQTFEDSGGTSYDEFILPFLGDEVVGDVSALMYSAALDTPKNQEFVKKYRAKYNKVPSYYSEGDYSAAQWIDETMAKHGGKYPGPEAFIKTMASIKLDAVRGPVELDPATRSPIQNIYIKKVEKKEMFGYGKPELWNTVIKTYPHVSQFWTYDKAKFLAQPVYSRDFPPCKNCGGRRRRRGRRRPG